MTDLVSSVMRMVDEGLESLMAWTSSSVVIHGYNSARPLNNRWPFSSNLIDLASLNDWSRPMSSDELSNVMRIKICGLRRRQLTDLLQSNLSELQILDIDTFELLRGKPIRLELASLRRLAIEAFKVVEPNESGEDREVPGGMSAVRLEAPNLGKVYLGPNAIKYILFVNPETIKHLVTNDPGIKYLKQFENLNLTHLELNEIRNEHIDLILALIGRQTLKELRCNVSYLDSTVHTFRPEDLKPLQTLFGHLAQPALEIRKKYPKIFFHRTRLDFGQPLLPSSSVCYAAQVCVDRQDDIVQLLRVTKCNSPESTSSLYIGRTLLPSRVISGTCPNIQAVFLNRPMNGDHLLAFLTRLVLLAELDLRNTGLRDDFLERLCDAKYTHDSSLAIVETLNAFTLIDSFMTAYPHYAFVSKFQRLRYFHTNLLTRFQLLDVINFNSDRVPLVVFLSDFLIPQTLYVHRWTVRKQFDFEQSERRVTYKFTVDEVVQRGASKRLVEKTIGTWQELEQVFKQK